MGIRYDNDVVAWAFEQAALLRSGTWSDLDIEHLAEEVEDVARSEQRELASRLQVLLSHLLEWQCQPARRSPSWRRTIRDQRAALARKIGKMPSLGRLLYDDEWLADVWNDAVRLAAERTGLEQFPENCPWSMDQVLDEKFVPE
jgi:hypothetical protein